MWSELERVDPEIARAIAGEETRQDRNLELIASENFVSEAVLAAQGSVLTNKYAEGYPGRRYYGGCECVDVAEALAIERAKRVFGAEHANVQPHSGTQANMAVYFGVLEPGDTILGMNLAHGGHLTHGSPVNFSGIMYNVVAYGVDTETEQIDYDEVRQKALECRPKLIVVGASAYPRTIDFTRFRSVADECGALLMADIAHIAGLIAAGLHSSPVGQADFVTTTTHKTLRGPRGGMVLCAGEHAKVIDKMVLPGIQGGPLMHIIAAKAVCLKEAMLPEFAAYQERILRNAKALASALTANDFRLVSGGTDNHLILVDMTSKGLTGKKAEKILDQAGITTNKNMIPFDTQKPLVTSGIRLGVPAVTTRGMGEAEMEVIAELIAETISAGDDPEELERIRGKVRNLTGGYPLPTSAHSLGLSG